MNSAAIIFAMVFRFANTNAACFDPAFLQTTPNDTLIKREFQVLPDSNPFDKDPTVIRKVDPEYPKEALKDSLEGNVKVKVHVNASGRVYYAEIEFSDNDIFNDAALKAARKWKFTPAILKGRPVSVWIHIPFHFSPKPKKVGVPENVETS